MGRRFGSRDSYKRHRKKSHKKRKLGFKSFPKSPKGHKTEIKVWWWKVQPISQEGLSRVNKNLRLRWHKQVYKPMFRVDVPIDRINSIESIKQFALDCNLYDGVYLLKTFSHAKNSYRVTARAVAVVKIKTFSEGMKVFVTPSFKNRSLKRYWFWKDK